MAVYIVGCADFFDNDLKLEKIEADSPNEAISKHSVFKNAETREWVSKAPTDPEERKEWFFNGDMLVDVLEI